MVKIQNNFTEVFFILPTTKIAQRVHSEIIGAGWAPRNIFKHHFVLNHWSKFKIISHKCTLWCPLQKLPIHHLLMCQDSGEQSRAIRPFCSYKTKITVEKYQGWKILTHPICPYVFVNSITSSNFLPALQHEVLVIASEWVDFSSPEYD